MTADSDSIPDFIVGGPGFAPSSMGTDLAGGGFVAEGAFLQSSLQAGTPNVITTPATIVPGSITATTVQIRVLSNATSTPPFRPATDINPANLFINGFQVTPGDVTGFMSVPDVNGDGIPDAVFTVPVADLHPMTTPTTSSALSLGGPTNTPGIFWIGTNGVSPTPTPTPTPTPGGGATRSGVPIGTIFPTTFVPPFGPDRFVPAPSTLSRLDYKPIPWRVAYRQFQPPLGFEERILNYFFPKKYHFQPQRQQVQRHQPRRRRLHARPAQLRPRHLSRRQAHRVHPQDPGDPHEPPARAPLADHPATRPVALTPAAGRPPPPEEGVPMRRSNDSRPSNPSRDPFHPRAR